MIGVELKKSEIDALNWYPVGYEPLIALVAKENFGWDDNDIFKRGRDSVKISLIVKMMLHFFISIEKVFEESSKFWRNSYDFGKVESVGRDGDVYIMRIKGYDIHPVSCIYNAGFIIGIAELSGGKGATIKEKTCTHKRGEYHEYHIMLKK